jgi:cation:H+ antiporter
MIVKTTLVYIISAALHGQTDQSGLSLPMLFVGLFIMLGVIVGGCLLFTNAVEWLGRRLSLSQGAVGSVLAAVGTALPETLVGVVAILLVGKGAGHQIGVGAILGAPLLLSTLAMPITGVAVLAWSRRRPQNAYVSIDRHVLARDLRWFYILFAIVLLVSLRPLWPVRLAAALVIMPGYAYYVRLHLREGTEEASDLAGLYFARRAHSPSFAAIAAQCLVALGVIVGAAYLFAQDVKTVSAALGASPFVLAAIIAPIATELPEKLNSLIWVRQGKDTLALGNVSGAMVFQGSVPVMLGMLLTEWHLDYAGFAAMLCAFGAALWLTLSMRLFRRLPAWALVVCFAFYVAWLLAVFYD